MRISLEEMTATPDLDGTWIRCADRQPPAYGRYTVIRRGRSGHYDYDEYLWNGGGWVTHGHSLSNAVEAWLERGHALATD